MVDITHATLADGREIIYFDDQPHPDRVLDDARDIPAVAPASEMRRDPLTGDWVAFAAHRMNRTFMPPANENPLAPTRPDQLPTEIPSPSYDVVVFENRFPSFSTAATIEEPDNDELLGMVPRLPAQARCEVVCFTEDPTLSFRELPESRIRTVIEAWAHRTAALSAIDGVQQVFPFENRGEEIGVTLQHPHGQIYSYPFLSPRLRSIVDSVRAYDGDLFQVLFNPVRDAVQQERALCWRGLAKGGEGLFRGIDSRINIGFLAAGHLTKYFTGHGADVVHVLAIDWRYPLTANVIVIAVAVVDDGPFGSGCCVQSHDGGVLSCRNLDCGSCQV